MQEECDEAGEVDEANDNDDLVTDPTRSIPRIGANRHCNPVDSPIRRSIKVGSVRTIRSMFEEAGGSTATPKVDDKVTVKRLKPQNYLGTSGKKKSRSKKVAARREVLDPSQSKIDAYFHGVKR